MKWNIIKLLLQLLLGYLLLFAAGSIREFFAFRVFAFTALAFGSCLVLACVTGIVLGDISIYKGAKLSGFAIVTAFFLAGVEFLWSMDWSHSLGHYFQPIHMSFGPLFEWISWWLQQIVTAAPMIIPPLIGYNIVTGRIRKTVKS